MRFRTTSAVLSFALIAACGAVQAQDDQTEQAIEQAASDELALEQVLEWVGDDGARIEAAMQELELAEPTDIVDSDDPLVGTYKLSSGFGKPRVTLAVLPNGDGTYAVRRIHEPRWGETSSLAGTGELGKKETITGKTLLRVTFGAELEGVAGRVASLGEPQGCPQGASAVYKIDAEIGRISGTFRADDDPETQGAYESGWREGATPVSFLDRTKRSAKIMSAKAKAKMGLIRGKLAERVASWRSSGQQVRAKLREFFVSVKDKTKAAAAKVAAATKRGADKVGASARSGWESTKRFGRSVRNHTADVMDDAADGIHSGAERVRADR